MNPSSTRTLFRDNLISNPCLLLLKIWSKRSIKFYTTYCLNLIPDKGKSEVSVNFHETKIPQIGGWSNRRLSGDSVFVNNIDPEKTVIHFLQKLNPRYCIRILERMFWQICWIDYFYLFWHPKSLIWIIRIFNSYGDNIFPPTVLKPRAREPRMTRPLCDSLIRTRVLIVNQPRYGKYCTHRYQKVVSKSSKSRQQREWPTIPKIFLPVLSDLQVNTEVHWGLGIRTRGVSVTV